MKHFFIVGMQRCATTYLQTLLDQHPQIYMAKINEWKGKRRPEPKFFMTSQWKNRDIYYETFFQNRSEPFLGEKSTSYSEKNEIPQRIYQVFPNAKIIILIRNPIERAVSNYFLSKKYGYENRSMEEAFFGTEPKCPPECSSSPYSYLKRGKYVDGIMRYKNLFDVKIVVTEELMGNKNELLKILEFIGADHFLSIDIGKIDSILRTTQLSSNLMDRLRDYYKDSVNQLRKILDKQLWSETWL